jgi:NAD(P)H dehydrogenase (quinone)
MLRIRVVNDMTKQLLIIYYTGTGKTQWMAQTIADGAREQGISVTVLPVEDCTIEDLRHPDGIVIGSPTYFSNMAWQVKKLVDESITLYRRDHLLQGKVAGCFTSSGTRPDGEDCIKTIEVAFGHHHKMKMLEGIVRVSNDPNTKIERLCKNYGRRIAKILAS